MELLVVISIIALLIAILLPSLSKAREQAKAIKCMSNARSLMLGVTYYVQDNRDVLPGPLHPPIFRTGDTLNKNTERPWFLLARLTPLMSKDDFKTTSLDDLATCPTLVQQLPDERFKQPQQVINDYGVSGANPLWSRPYHYLPNTWGNTAPVYYFGYTNTGITWTGFEGALDPGEELYKTNGQRGVSVSYHKPKAITLIKRPADEWALGEAWYSFALVPPPPGTPGPPIPKPTAVGTWQHIPNPGSPKNTAGSSANPLRNKPPHRDRKGTNLAYFDGHGGTFTGIDKDWANQFPANRNPN